MIAKAILRSKIKNIQPGAKFAIVSSGGVRNCQMKSARAT